MLYKAANRYFFGFIFIALVTSCFSQTQFDTLVIGPKKYLLEKSKIFHPYGQNNSVNLPSEYTELINPKILKFKFKALADSSYETFFDDEYGEITILKLQDKVYPYGDSISFLYAVADTIELLPKEFLSLKPYIRSNTKKIFFCASKVDKLYHDTVTIASHSYITDGSVLSFWQPPDGFTDSDISELRQTSFILRDLHYLKGDATFYLARKFVIKIK